MVAVRFADWPLTVPVTVAVPLLQVVGRPPFCEGSRISNVTCPVMLPFCCRKNPPCNGLAAKEEPDVLILNCQLPLAGALFVWAEPPPQLEFAKTTTSNKTQRPIVASAGALCVGRNFRSIGCRTEFMK